jgi:diaminopimelate epimerase
MILLLRPGLGGLGRRDRAISFIESKPFLNSLDDVWIFSEAEGMRISFMKMNGAGNDFVMLDNRSLSLSLSKDQIAKICDRHRGVGADGLLLIEPSKVGEGEFRMRYYNSDGGEAEMCGNGARCFARFAQKTASTKDKISFQTLAGLIGAELDGSLVKINLSEPTGLKLRESVKLSSGETKIHSLNTGVPHAVLIVEDADRAMVGPLGNEIRFHPHFSPKGTNVNFVQLLDSHNIRVRTYERGVEGETLACGTGVTASALIASMLFQLSSPLSVKVQGGDTLEVSFTREGERFKDVFLKGPADFTFEGWLDV